MTAEDKNDAFISSIVAAYAARPEVGPDEIVELVRKLRHEMGEAPEPATAQAGQPGPQAVPALPIAEAVTQDKVYCLCCGKGFKMLKRHIGSEHGLTEEQYRRMFGLTEDTPLVAPSYSERKARYAKERGLGTYARGKSAARTGTESVSS
ncbi:MucR family transcriptional regulator [Roseivivax sp. GX 12232]|uniref:MucR family transcriptional regulator n=1 Tax=Roseivivax sp. GX 12232 TaxID=2900547 RepID=UPI001E5FCAEC|nr:MucR family transcriptional regulator [Roseivivax sp. GX 12232]MCE0503902.1 MucR family transcriptional regulator [Roseivivax sp. GX 12232]